MAALRVLESHFGSEPDPRPVCAAGHSLGELSALTAARALSFADGLRLVRRRGELMKRAGEQAPGGMAAILGLDISTLESICAQASRDGEIVQVANDNCPGQTVISGSRIALERAVEAARAAGARRALPLAVSIAAHSVLMAVVQTEFETAVRAVPLAGPLFPVISNVTARPMTAVLDIQADLSAQLTARVRWTESVQTMRGLEVDTFVEIGSGSVLTGLLKRIDSEAKGLFLGAPADFAQLS
jgi:[acyl-carrier-protein] S-malonyltransferase